MTLTYSSAFYQHILSLLPAEMQAVVLDPPDLARPSSWIPVVRALFPYARYLVVLLAFYIVWTTISGLFGYFSRFMRFAFRVSPILAIIGWVMASSRQGSMEELFGLIKQWMGLSPNDNRASASPGIASLTGLFSSDSELRRGSAKRRTSAGSR
jgi:hypothetical protein